ncbi:exosortase-associated EpsI family protein [Tautonia plasticadhaerens]|uniref:Methanolan biosynthesis EpsI domain-containing protein n=1 Tax=Tautonia plasticadhaerens TaxID=2527974 RepID=A0A518HFJ6_9BACT|nr:exosortase-associated EpsI family protein [Tautonia plasticadhaerens]QDV39617.1 hypothetical protein ElP_75880 [Tautonia plasticadhaerens]
MIAPAATSAEPDRRLGPSPWPWMILACAIVAASGAIRVNQESAFADAARSAEVAPFRMADLPPRLGEHWEQIGEDQILEEETLQIAGCADYVLRNYIDNRTGVALTVLVAFGPADRVFPHSPIVCFPANGFQSRGGPWRRQVDVGGSSPDGDRKVGFSALVYGKPGGGVEELREVYYSYWHDGTWSPDQSQNLFRHRPAMFKIQVERPVVPGEARGDGSPIEGFLQDLVPEVERRYAASQVETTAGAGVPAED